MNIKAAQAVLKLDDRDPRLKVCLLAIACHADRYSAAATISQSRLIADTGLGAWSLRRVLEKAEVRGYLHEEARPGRASVWTIRMGALERRPFVVDDSPAEPAKTITPEDVDNRLGAMRTLLEKSRG
ncbi:MAG: hypothetical protein J2P57_04930 [Acidimicrobiaceae bacterium]|nr:hypothetical protein [Acidimicrobiaceae bacterium]